MEKLLLEFINDDLLADDPDVVVDRDDELLVDGYIDSLGVMRLVSFVDEELGIRIPPQDVTIDNLASVATLAGYLAKRQSATG